VTIEGMAHTPTQADSHAALQQRQGWSVAAMRDEIEALQRQLNGFQSHVRNALNLMRLVNCGNLDQAKINQAIVELESIDKRRRDHA